MMILLKCLTTLLLEIDSGAIVKLVMKGCSHLVPIQA